MGKYESDLANQILAIFEERISPTSLTVIPVLDKETYNRLRPTLRIDSRARVARTNGRREVFAGIDIDLMYGRYQMTAIFDGLTPVAVSTLGVETKGVIRNLGYVRVGDDTGTRFSFEEVYGWLPDYLIVPAFAEVLPEYRRQLRTPGLMATDESIKLLATRIQNGVVELVVQGDNVNIGVPRDESQNVARIAQRLGLEQLAGIGSLPSLGPVFFRRTSILNPF